MWELLVKEHVRDSIALIGIVMGTSRADGTQCGQHLLVTEALALNPLGEETMSCDAGTHRLTLVFSTFFPDQSAADGVFSDIFPLILLSPTHESTIPDALCMCFGILRYTCRCISTFRYNLYFLHEKSEDFSSSSED